MIQHNFPEIEVHGENYPPPPLQSYLASALGYFKLALILSIVSGYNIFELVGMPTPAVMTWAWENKLYASMMIFFVSNAIEGQLIATGAFEISFNGVEVWSKLRSGRPPSANELFEILNSQSSSASTSFSKPPKSVSA
ncbi:selenoprotein T2-like [Convolutriloba macropyga]|uniref:selenoprotein T2-like n=1 Tax=Convolutriloba macropyga TaxID=536237 RepID=UPI003F51CBDC